MWIDKISDSYIADLLMKIYPATIIEFFKTHKILK